MKYSYYIVQTSPDLFLRQDGADGGYYEGRGADFAAAIRRYCDCDSNPRNELAADVAEKYVIAVEVFPDGAARIHYTKPSERRQQ